MERKIYSKLLDWKQRGAKKPLMVLGARQVGKSYIIEEFCRREFPDFHMFNLLDERDIVNLFKEDTGTRDKLDKLEMMIGHRIDFENTALFFDEAQASEEIIASLKFFAEAKTPYKILCAGSLLGVKINRFSQSFPVGKVEMLHLAPLDFEEFLVAAGEQGLRDEIRSCFTTNRAIIKPLHEKCLRLYRLYLCAGGMPEAVLDLIEHDLDILLFRDSILRDIRSSYLKDMSKYIHSPLESARIEDAYDSLPAQLSNKSGKFQFARIRSGARGRDYGSALDWLLSSGMIYRCERVSKPLMPLKGYRDKGFFKLFLNDTGLLCDALEISRNLVVLDSAFSYKGVLAESYVACQLAAAGRSLYYWQSGNTAEVDFLLQYDEGIIPLETKAGRWTVSPSMRVFAERFRPPYCVKVSTRNFGLENGIRSVPLYAVFCL